MWVTLEIYPLSTCNSLSKMLCRLSWVFWTLHPTQNSIQKLVDFTVIIYSWEKKGKQDTEPDQGPQKQALTLILFYKSSLHPEILPLLFRHVLVIILEIKKNMAGTKSVKMWQPVSVFCLLTLVAVNDAFIQSVVLKQPVYTCKVNQEHCCYISVYLFYERVFLCWQCTHFPRSYYRSVLLKGMFPVCHC